MKRERSDDHSITMANCLMLLSEAAASFGSVSSTAAAAAARVFACKTCNRQFSSFQALGGHRASHKKPRIMAGEDSNNGDDLLLHPSPAKPKTHECSICGLEFPIGQALGGHMRRHRAPTSHNNNDSKNSSSSSSSSGEFDSDKEKKKKEKSKRVLFLDLNLTPLENDLEILGINTSTPLVVTL